MIFSPSTIVFAIYFVVFMGIQTIILMGYIDLRRKHLQLKEEVEKLRGAVDELKRK
jgi:CHASE3 domain sensor protein